MSRQALLVLLAIALSNAAMLSIRLGRPAAVRAAVDWLAARGRMRVVLIALPIAIWLGIFVVYGHPITGDVAEFYRPQGRAALDGGIPNRDFRSSYMPLFPYLVGAVDRAWPADLAIPLFIALCCAAFGLLWHRVLAGAAGRSAAAMSLAAVVNGAMWFLGIGYQQDEILIVTVLAAAVLLMLRGRDGWAGIALGLGCAATKVLVLVAAAGLIAAARHRVRLASGVAAGLAPVVVIFALLGASPLEMVRQEAASLQPPSLTVLAAAAPPLYETVREHAWVFQLAIAGWLVLIAGLARPAPGRPRLETIAAGLAAAWLVFLLLSPKALTSYRLVVLPFLPLLLPARPAALAAFAIYSTAVGVEYMLYEDWISRPYALALGAAASPADVLRLAALLTLDLVIVGCEAVWLLRALSRLRAPDWLRGRHTEPALECPGYV